MNEPASLDRVLDVSLVAEGRYALDVPDGWAQGRGAFGGLVLGAMLRAVTRAEPDPARRVRSVTGEIPAPVLPGLAVRVQQTELPATLYGVPYPVAPGAVVVEASAPGHLPFRREVQVGPSETSSVEVQLDAAPVVVVPTVPVARPVEARGAGAGPWIVAGTGAAALVLGGVFYGLASGERSDRDAACDHGVDCRPEAQTHDDRYAGYLTATNVALGVGAAALAGGATWFIVSRLTRRDTHHAALRWNVSPSPTGLTLGLEGRF